MSAAAAAALVVNMRQCGGGGVLNDVGVVRGWRLSVASLFMKRFGIN